MCCCRYALGPNSWSDNKLNVCIVHKLSEIIMNKTRWSVSQFTKCMSVKCMIYVPSPDMGAVTGRWPNGDIRVDVTLLANLGTSPTMAPLWTKNATSSFTVSPDVLVVFLSNISTSSATEDWEHKTKLGYAGQIKLCKKANYSRKNTGTRMLKTVQECTAHNFMSRHATTSRHWWAYFSNSYKPDYLRVAICMHGLCWFLSESECDVNERFIPPHHFQWFWASIENFNISVPPLICITILSLQTVWLLYTVVQN